MGSGLLTVALAAGVLAAQQPPVLIAILGLVVLLALPFVAPVTHLTLLIFVTAIVPFGLQNGYSIGGGAGAPGLLLCDVLLMGGLLRAAIVLPRERLDARRLLVGGLMVTFMGLATLQFVHGVSSGVPLSRAGFELRVLLAFGTLLVALPIVAAADARVRLFRGLLLLGLLLGLWAVAQWVIDIPESVAGDVGVRQGVAYTTSGHGQIQGGLYAFPVAVVLAFTALISGYLRSWWTRLTVLAVLALNVGGMMLTYERTFWLTTVAALGFVILRADPPQRRRALLGLPAVAASLLVAMAVVAPDELKAAGERLLSLSQHARDESVRWRIVESDHVLDEIRAHPLAGSGLGATIYWGQPWVDVPPKTDWYAHNGYLWLAWKLGIPVTAFFCLLLVWVTLWRLPAPSSPFKALQLGAQGALAVLLLSSITFPSFNGLAITATMGLLLAIVIAPAAQTAHGRASRPPAAASLRGTGSLAHHGR